MATLKEMQELMTEMERLIELKRQDPKQECVLRVPGLYAAYKATVYLENTGIAVVMVEARTKHQ